ncbi:MAG: hypothetical protein JO149_09565 [Gammaproteobacteria bacterium]|nr:hypothetical protein [Gammaproteobacteria bacterium]
MAKIILTILCFWILTLAPVFGEAATLRIPLHASTISLDPSKVQDVSSLWVSRQINCQLIRMNQGVPTLEAALSIQYITPILIDIKLKPNINFNNGSEVTAQDVIATFDYLREKRSENRNVFGWIESMTLKNKYELLIKLKHPTPQLFTVLSAPHYAIFDKNFIAKVRKNPSLWSEPVSCGDYKIEENSSSVIALSPIKGKGLPIRFYLVPDSQLLNKDLDKYDLVSMQVIGNSNNLSNFKLMNVFDPFQYYFVLNTRIPPWNNRNARCAFFSRINPNIVMSVYEERAEHADNLLPSGTLGYEKNANYMEEIISNFKNVPLPAKKTICVSPIATSIEKDYRDAYLEMIKKIYPNVTSKLINNYTDLNSELQKEKCDGVFYAAKSNYLDAYEYFVTFSEKGPSATGFHDKELTKQIKKSQDIDRADLRAKAYHNIVKAITHECLMYPLFTMPYDIVYVRNNLNVTGISEESINEYLLSNVKLN